ncbi:uncharacterized protein SCHCODRAFT_01098778 [Schizophyllum commune H4-8]|nr:uncharacterized protein SCHCODRAFT_01098778 [Schizophyllum commune H4-8]KAI5889849.1 hypothetical protein SCHCODRAFT_01098778 [Schizophyllum commune H4-8]
MQPQILKCSQAGSSGLKSVQAASGTAEISSALKRLGRRGVFGDACLTYSPGMRIQQVLTRGHHVLPARDDAATKTDAQRAAKAKKEREDKIGGEAIRSASMRTSRFKQRAGLVRSSSPERDVQSPGTVTARDVQATPSHAPGSREHVEPERHTPAPPTQLDETGLATPCSHPGSPLAGSPLLPLRPEEYAAGWSDPPNPATPQRYSLFGFGTSDSSPTSLPPLPSDSSPPPARNANHDIPAVLSSPDFPDPPTAAPPRRPHVSRVSRGDFPALSSPSPPASPSPAQRILHTPSTRPSKSAQSHRYRKQKRSAEMAVDVGSPTAGKENVPKKPPLLQDVPRTVKLGHKRKRDGDAHEPNEDRHPVSSSTSSRKMLKKESDIERLSREMREGREESNKLVRDLINSVSESTKRYEEFLARSSQFQNDFLALLRDRLTAPRD